MATPQWILVQNRLQPTSKPDEKQFELNTKKRQRDAVRSAIKRGVLRVLDQQLVTEHYSSSNLNNNEIEREDMTYLSLPSLSIHTIDELLILSCPRLTILDIPCNFISDLRPLQSCINLIKLDASINQIQVLPDEKFWSALISLKILYLHGNLIGQKECLLGLSGCPQLQILTLYDTPVSVLSNYRHIAANCILTLKALDYHVISDEEIIANLQLQGKFRALARSFNKLLYLSVNKDGIFETEMKRIHSLLLMVDTVQSHYSPVILIQRWIRGWLTRVKISKNDILNVITKRRQKKTCGDLKNILSKHSSLHAGTQSSSWLQQPPPSPRATTPNPLMKKEETTTTEERYLFLKRPDTAELYQAITNARSILKNPITKKSKKVTFISRRHSKRDPSIETTSQSKESLSISGKHCSVESLDKLQELKETVKESSQDIKRAKNEIKSIVQQVKGTIPNINKNETEITADVHRFIRSHATMSLELLRKIEKRYRYDRKSMQIASKNDLVAQVRYERELRRERLASYQQIVKENVLTWKNEEDKRLEKERLKNELKREDSHLRRVYKVENEVQVTQDKLENENFAVKFRQGHVKIGNNLSRKKIKTQKDQESQSVQDYVQSLKETDSERQETAKKYIKERERRLKRDILQDKNDLNAQMIQMASQQLMEARQKVEKEKARKKAAQDLSPLVTNTNIKDTPRQDLIDAYQSIPKAPIADTGLLGPLMRACESYTCSPKSMRGRTLGSHRTWQRGSHTMDHCTSGVHFPEIGSLPEETPLMYNMYRPLPQHWHNVGTTPYNSPKYNTVVPTTPTAAAAACNNTNSNDVVLTVGNSNLYSTTINANKYSGDEDRQLINLLTYSL